MASPAAIAHTLADEQLGELLALMADADSVELKLTVPESDHYSVAAALGVDVLDAQMRQVYFFDTPDLSLNKLGVVLRARRVQRKSGDSVVKLRPVIPAELPKSQRKSPGFSVELDAMPGGYVCSAILKRSVGNADVRQVVAGTRPLSALFSKEQRATGMKTSGTVAHAPSEAPRVMGLRTAVPAPLGPRENERSRSDAPPENATPTAGR